MQKIAIIGAGAGGMIAAITAARAGAHVQLFEQNDAPGKKLRIAGNGKCNISNAKLDAKHYHCEDKKFINYLINEFNFPRFEKFCFGLGLPLLQRDGGKAYPASLEGKAVVSAFVRKLGDLGVTLRTGCKITAIDKDRTFTLHGEKQSFEGFDKVLLAAGSQAAPGLGGSAGGYALAQSFGHECRPTFPALVQYELQSGPFAIAAGVKTEAGLTLLVEGRKHYETRNDLLFTKYGLSGLAVLDSSYLGAKALQQGKKVSLGLDLFPEHSVEELENLLLKLYKANKHYDALALLNALLHSKVAKALLRHCGIEGTLDRKKIKKLCFSAKNWEFAVADTHGFAHAEISGGGIDVTEVEKTTMESKKQKGLYLCGEMLDVAGKRGGYNLHFAWAGGFIAGRAMGT